MRLPGGEVIIAGVGVPCGEQPIDQVAGNKAGCAGDEEAHQVISIAVERGLRAMAIRFSRNGNLITTSPTTRCARLKTGASCWNKPPKVVLWVIAVILW